MAQVRAAAEADRAALQAQLADQAWALDELATLRTRVAHLEHPDVPAPPAPEAALPSVTPLPPAPTMGGYVAEENEALRRQVETLSRERVRLDGLVATTEQALSTLRESTRAVAEEQSARGSRLARLREELVARQERINEHERQLDHVRDQLRDREAELSRKEGLVLAHKRTLDEHQQRLEASLQQKLSAVQSRTDALRVKEARVEDDRARLEAAEVERRRRGAALAEQETRLAAIRASLEQQSQGVPSFPSPFFFPSSSCTYATAQGSVGNGRHSLRCGGTATPMACSGRPGARAVRVGGAAPCP